MMAGGTDLTHVNILAELYMETGLFEQTHSLIERAERMLLSDPVAGGAGAAEEEAVATQMPLDLIVKSGE